MPMNSTKFFTKSLKEMIKIIFWTLKTISSKIYSKMFYLNSERLWNTDVADG